MQTRNAGRIDVWGGLVGAIFLCGVFSAGAHAKCLPADDARMQAFEAGLVDRDARGDADARRWTIEERMAHHSVPGVGVAIIEDGAVVCVKGYGVKRAGEAAMIDADTVFSVGSVSKMVNAALVLRLVAEGLVDLDTDVNDYLTSWKVPEGRHTRKNKVTLRAILSHTAGFSQHGFADFEPGEELPTAIETLNGTGPVKHGPVRLRFAPGKKFDYSGGGITVSQVLVEDVTGMTYTQAAKKYVLDPLGMSRSTFVNPLPASHGNIARAHDRDGAPTALPRGWEAMPEMAASGLWTSATDLAAFVIALQESYAGTGDFLPQDIAADMMTRVPPGIHGMGPRLNGEGASHVFHHGGANNSYRAWIQGFLQGGDGLVVLTNATRGSLVHGEMRKSAEAAFGWPAIAKD
ncbi:MAG: serine hydrolase domain-containing protein [Pseudomonadota bacterium]